MTTSEHTPSIMHDERYERMSQALGFRAHEPGHLSASKRGLYRREVYMLNLRDPLPEPTKKTTLHCLDGQGQPTDEELTPEVIGELSNAEVLYLLGPMATAVAYRCAGYRVIVSEDRRAHIDEYPIQIPE